MKYRKLPHGSEIERFSVLGLGMGGIQKSSDAEIEAVIKKAMAHGINFFDLCGGAANIYVPFGKAILGKRDRVFIQIHLGAVYDENGDYGWSRDINKIKSTFEWELEQLGTDYVDFGFLHCVDEMNDLDEIEANGIFDYLKELKSQGIVRHIGFSSHTPAVANRLIDTGLIDMMLFSINAAYDYEKGDEYGIGTVSERANLFRRCEKEGIGISVMKPFHGGQLLNEGESPFGVALTHNQCLQYVLDRPGVLTAVPGVRNLSDLDELLPFIDASDEEKDYSVIASFTLDVITGNCVYCGHCKPCPAGIDVGLINKYYDLARLGDNLAVGHYNKLIIKADSCLECGHCDERCPFKVHQSARMKKIAEYFSK